MNLLRASVRATGEKLVFQIGAQSLEAEKRQIESLHPACPQTGNCLLGVRPEEVMIRETRNAFALKAKIKSCEYLGREILVQCDVEGQPFVFLAPENICRAGERMSLGIPLEKAHFYRADF